MIRPKVTKNGNVRKRYKRVRRFRSRLRTMARPSGYEAYDFMAILTPDLAEQDPHGAIITAIKNSGQQYRIKSHVRFLMQRTRIYCSDESGLVLMRMVDPNMVWKVFKLVDENCSEER